MSGSYHGERNQSAIHRSNPNAEPPAAVFAGAHAATTADADIIALSDEVIRLAGVTQEIHEARIEPFADEFDALIREIFTDRSISPRLVISSLRFAIPAIDPRTKPLDAARPSRSVELGQRCGVSFDRLKLPKSPPQSSVQAS
jgi:hypothetical protein